MQFRLLAIYWVGFLKKNLRRAGIKSPLQARISRDTLHNTKTSKLVAINMNALQMKSKCNTDATNMAGLTVFAM